MIQLPEKLTAAKLAEIAKINPAAAAEVKKLMARKHTRKVSYWVEEEGWQCHLGEGMQYTFFAPNGNQLATKMAAEETWMNTKNDGVNHHVGEPTPPLPANTFVISFEYFQGKPCIGLTHVAPPALPA